MIGLVQRSAERAPDHLAVVGESRSLTYGQLLAEARDVAIQLRSSNAGRVAVAEDDPVTSLIVLVGCAYAGIEVCVLPRAATDETVLSTAERLGSATIVTSRELEGPRVLATAAVVATTADDALGDPAADGSVLVLTSGTTRGAPRAARHLWSRLIAPVAATRPTPEQRWLLSYGLNQFGGLQVVLHVFAAAATLYIPDSFQPRHASPLLTQWSITHASGTPTFWRFALLELVGATLPPLTQITLSGEAVPASVLADLKNRFPTAHISQVYAATEFGAAITVKDGLPGIPEELLTARDHIQFEVRNGELWVRSMSSMLGYRDAGSDPAEEDLDWEDWRPTGDTVEIIDGRVQFRGRTSEVINVGGVKVHPVPIEERIASVDGVVVVRVSGRPNPVVGAVVAAEVVVAPGYDPETVTAGIRTACEDLPPSWRPRSIKVVDDLLTSGNKIARGAR
jgi:acyl-CoA synthetase (AMP-forming)/AMP-acid ligase II